MKYISVRQPGDPSVLVLAETSAPEPKEDEVLIKVHAAGVNRPDCLQRQGLYPPPPGASPILGLELAGTVVACGPRVTRYTVGDAVCALVSGGAYAELAVAPEGQCLPLPRGFDFIQAAALPETFFTVWTNLFEDGRLQKGESVLIHGGTGGIGTTAIQLAHAFGAKIFTTIGKRTAAAACQEAGADHVIFYKEEDFLASIQQLTQQTGVDVVLDIVGGDTFPRNIQALGMRGRLIQIATLEGAKVELDLRAVMGKRLTITGSTLRSRPVAEKTRIAMALEKNVWPLLSAGQMKPIVHAVFPLAEAGRAHELMESRGHTGKIVLSLS